MGSVPLYIASWGDFFPGGLEKVEIPLKFLLMMTIYKNDGKYDNSNVKLNNRGDIFYNKENPDASFKYIDYGLIFFKREVFEETVIGKTFDLSEMLHKLSKQFRIAGFEVQSRFYEVGSFSGIIELETYLRKKNNVVQ